MGLSGDQTITAGSYGPDSLGSRRQENATSGKTGELASRPAAGREEDACMAMMLPEDAQDVPDSILTSSDALVNVNIAHTAARRPSRGRGDYSE